MNANTYKPAHGGYPNAPTAWLDWPLDANPNGEWP